VKTVLAKKRIAWRSFWNGSRMGDGPISRAWNVTGWPTVYVLDAKGRIRFKSVHDDQLDHAVDKLLAEIKP
jgi:hypothetical protein